MHGGETRGLLQPLLLLLLYERPGHGYELLDRLDGMGFPEVEPGQAYRALRTLERRQLVVSTWVTSDAGPARRRYRLTGQGMTHLEASMSRLMRLGQALDSCLERWSVASRTAVATPGGRSPDGDRGSCTAS